MADVAGGSIVWDLKLEVDKFNKELGNVKNQVKDLTNTIEKQRGPAEGLNKTIGKLAVGYLAFKALGVVNGFIQESIDKFNEAQAVSTNLTNTFLNQKGATMENVDALRQQADQLSNTTTFSEQQIMMAQATIGTFDGMTAELTQKAIPAFLDYAAKQYLTIDSIEGVKQAAEGYTKAAVGQADVLTKQGFKFTDLQKEILKTGTASERLKVVTDAMAYASGAAAAQAQTLEGRQKVLANQFDKAQLAVGGMAQLLKTELLNAFIQSSNSGETWGNNMLTLAKQVGTGFVDMANIAGQALIGLFSLANRAAKAIGVVQNMKAQSEVFSAEKTQTGVAGFFNGSWMDRAADKITGQETKSLDELKNKAKETAGALSQYDEELAKIGEQSLALSESTQGIKDKISGITSVAQLESLGLSKLGNATRDMNEEGKKSAEDNKKAKDAEAKALENATEKVIDFRQKEIEMSKKITEANDKQKESLSALKAEYEKTIAGIVKNLADLDKSFAKGETSAQSSFLSSLASAADTAKKTIEDRKKQILTEQNKGAGADQSIIGNLQGLNDRDQAILDANAEQIAKAQQIEADKKTALGVQQVISQYNQERAERQAQYEQDKSDLRTQLAEKEEEYKKSQLKIKTDTVTSIADIRTSYLKMFDDLQRELASLGESFLNLMKLGAISAPGPSKDAEAAYAALLKKVPKFADGGIVGGMTGQPQLAVVHGGERITPVNQAGGGNTFNFQISEKVDVAYVLKEVQDYLAGKGLQSQFGIS